MGDIIQCNIRGLKTEHLRGEKVDLIVKVLAEQNTKILNLQETRLNSLSHIPKELLYYNNIYKIAFCVASYQDQGSGILVFVKKTEEIIQETTLWEGRLIHLQIKNIASEEIIYFFLFMENLTQIRKIPII